MDSKWKAIVRSYFHHSKHPPEKTIIKSIMNGVKLKESGISV